MKPEALREARPLSLVVIETGARWPGSVANHASLVPNCLVIKQQRSESDPLFAQRVIARIGALQSKGCSLRTAIVSTRTSQSAQALDARSRIARSLVHAGSKSGPAELVLVGSSEAGARHDLFAIAGALCEGLAGSNMVVRVSLNAASTRQTHSFDEMPPDSRAA